MIFQMCSDSNLQVQLLNEGGMLPSSLKKKKSNSQNITTEKSLGFGLRIGEKISYKKNCLKN